MLRMSFLQTGHAVLVANHLEKGMRERVKEEGIREPMGILKQSAQDKNVPLGKGACAASPKWT